ncbi:membrane protein [Lactobacillus delbrueckii subsp. delbrueckii DSM 20074 = JCM 1012]|uniref:Membrane protein n=1 Tax=Lactobacillus delbrueckii subsp. delbrueckii TaxID=83684 RepID=A0AAU9R4Q7_9LACO|nr:membrane protein [Lactobacillus delbrueckii subsp. delbrueckii DSM 20074 = JCM 1012]CAH1707102.1 Membrane protein [Lactobacillus delbrueckii subsp. delbrueckii]
MLLAVLIITFGFFKTLFVLIFVAIGIAAGYYIQKTGILTDVFK